MQKLIEIDGSMLEGGGSVVRLSAALSALLRRPVRIRNIRAGRPQPGLRSQHLRGLELLSSVWGGRLQNARIGSGEVVFYPGKPAGGQFRVSLETAGSTGLVIQSLLLAAVKAPERLDIAIEGGATFGLHAPPLQYIQFVLLPLLRRMGFHAEINIIRHGFYPAGGASVRVSISPCRSLSPIVLEDAGKVTEVDVISVASASLKMPRVAERQMRTAEALLRERGFALNKKMRYSEASCPGSGIVLVARTDTGCIIGSDGLGERGKKAEDVAAQAVAGLLLAIDSRAAADGPMGDQLLPYMALSGKRCSITVPVVTSHAQTNMRLLEHFLPVEFSVEGKGHIFRISCAPAGHS